MLSAEPQKEPNLERVFDQTLSELDRCDRVCERYLAELSEAIPEFPLEAVCEESVRRLFHSAPAPLTAELPLWELDVERYPQFRELANFYLHDMAHLRSDGVMYTFWYAETFLSDQDGIIPEAKQYLHSAIQTLPAALKLLRFPSQLLRQLIALERGGDMQTSRFSLSETLKAIAYQVSQRDLTVDFAVTTPEKRCEEQNEIIIDCPPICLDSSWPAVTSIFFNLVKNSYKMLRAPIWNAIDKNEQPIESLPLISRLKFGNLPTNPAKIYVMARDIPEAKAVVVHVADNGKGIQIDDVLWSLRNLHSCGLLKQADAGAIYDILQQWSRNDFAVRNLKIADVFEAAFLPLVSGNATLRHNEVSSGLGLWGCRMLTDHLGGKIISTNRYEGGAQFSVILPYETQTSFDSLEQVLTVADQDSALWRQLRAPSLQLAK